MKAMMIMLAAACLVPVGIQAQPLAFDFDTDGDPSTVADQITADVGEIVEAYLVVSGLPAGFAYLHGLQYGLSISDGLELVGYGLVASDDGGLTGGMGIDDPAGDGAEGIALTLETAIPVGALPRFAMRFAVRVLDAGEQSVAVVPSTGWGTSYVGFVFLVSTSGSPDDVEEIVDAGAIEGQRTARINADPTPVDVVSWGAVKGSF